MKISKSTEYRIRREFRELKKIKEDVVDEEDKNFMDRYITFWKKHQRNHYDFSEEEFDTIIKKGRK